MLTRRKALQAAAAGGLAVALGRSTQAQDQEKIRMSFLGVGDRGTSLLRLVLDRPDVEIPCICDINERHLNRAIDLVEKSRGYRPEGFSKGEDDYRRMLQRDDFNSILIATPQEPHAVHAMDSMKAGKFVGSEVPACVTLEECFDLVRAQRETKAGYMLLENYCYLRPVMQVLNMARQKIFGDLTWGYGSYIHDIRGMRFNPDGSLTWRGQSVRDNSGIIYPTHAMGPVCQWMGINRDDRLVSLVAMSSKPTSMHQYAVKTFGEGSEPAKVQFNNGDTNHALIKTEKGRLIEVRYDTASPRPGGMGEYALQGAGGAYQSMFEQRNVYIEARSPEHQWEPLEKYQAEYEHPFWAQRGKDATAAGHDGGDWFVINEFLIALRTGQSPIDVIDAVTWSCIRPLSAESLKDGGKPVDIPDFRA